MLIKEYRRFYFGVIMKVSTKKNAAIKAVESVHTTVGELIETITKLALESGKSEEEGYLLAQATLENILRRKAMAQGNGVYMH